MELSTNEIQSSQLCRYTIIPINDPQHRAKLDKFVAERGQIQNKTSLCRFYLRGICIMKPEYCKFAHSIYELRYLPKQPEYQFEFNNKQRKKQFGKKREFNQTALFILKNVPYKVLYDYQFSQRYKKSKMPVKSLEQIRQERGVRIRIREIMHRENWDGFLDCLETNFPKTQFPISFLSLWFGRFGFDKPQTRCKFGDFLKYMMNVRKFYQVQIVIPPSTERSVIFINSQKKQTYLQQNSEQIYELNQKHLQQENLEKIEEIQRKQLPIQYVKKFMCRYYMAGNCQKSAQQCGYSHSIQELAPKFQLNQQFPKQYRQIIMPLLIRLNYLSLSEFSKTIPEFSQYSLEDINYNTNIRNQLRELCHFKLFEDFMKFIEKILPQNHVITLQELKRYYQGAGFNHTNQNKFQHLQNILWNLGYYVEDTHAKDEKTLEKKKVSYVLKVPPISQLDEYYQIKIKEAINIELEKVQEDQQILQSMIRRGIYALHQKFTIPLHTYLRAKKQSFQEVIQSFFPTEIRGRIFFETGQQNLKKLGELIKKYFKKNKRYLHKIQDIELHVRNQNKESININHFVNLKQIIQQTILDTGRKLYFWPFDNNVFVLDKNHFASYQKQHNRLMAGIKQEAKKQFIDDDNDLGKQIIQIVDNEQQLILAEKYLERCCLMGVDLEGKLHKNGYIDLVQVSGVRRNTKNKIIHKQIFIFDVWKMKQQAQQSMKAQNLLNKTISLLKNLFENKNKVKILHDCRQDSTALSSLLAINIKTVFDTSGYDVYLNQFSIYQNEGKTKSSYLLKKIYDVKVPGLNTILDKYYAPNGVNIFKDSMKKRFSDPNNRPYFQQRPIDPQFLQYSARDVEDLVEVYETMTESEVQCLQFFIGDLYSGEL